MKSAIQSKDTIIMKTQQWIVAKAFAIVFTLAQAQAAPINLITNGSFEQPGGASNSGAIPGWEAAVGTAPTGTGSIWGITPSDGNNLLMLVSSGVNDSNWQTCRRESADSYFTLTAGKTYTLSIDAYGSSASNKDWVAQPWEEGKMNVLLAVLYRDGAKAGQDLFLGTMNTVKKGTWTTQSFTFTAPNDMGNGKASLNLWLKNDGWNTNTKYIYMGVDNVKLVPEPASLALLGLSSVMLLRRRRA